ncbi:hypothetical protein ACF0H5_003115 [Mactra antiquata]
MWKEVLSALISLSLTQTCTGLTCLTCDDAVDPTDCGTVLTCGDHEHCFLESYVTVGGHLRYNMGCRDSLQCSQSDPADENVQSDSVLVCSVCCLDDLCNSEGCNTLGYPVSRGPICYNCLSQRNVDDCDYITMCGRDEVCRIHEVNNTVTHVKRYQTTCALKTKCEEEQKQLTEAQRNDDICHVGCCTDDLCNVACDNSNIQIPLVDLTTLSTTAPKTEAQPSTTTSSPSTTNEPSTTTSSPSTTNAPSTTTVSHCQSNPCVHGSCSEDGSSFRCTCDEGFYGHLCAQVKSTHTAATTTQSSHPCQPNPCHHGKCLVEDGSFKCDCHSNYTGVICDTGIRPNTTTTSTSTTTTTTTTTTPTPRDPCHGYDCKHDSKCIVENHKPKCICSPAYYGYHCENRRHCESTSAYKHTFDWNHRKLHASFVQVSMNHHDALRYCKSHCLGQLIQLTTMDKYNLVHNYLRHGAGYIHMDFWVDGTWSGHHWTTSSGDRLVEQSEAWRRTTSWGVDGHCTRFSRTEDFVLNDHSCLKCLVCDDMVDPTDCNIVLTCGDYQECFLESYVNIGGFKRYKMGCRDSLQCGQSDPTGNLLVCSHCCQNDLCNSQGCSTQGYPKSRGPLCFNCQSQKYVDDCISITMCGRDEVCRIHEVFNTVTHVKRYQTSCEPKTKCEEEQLMLTTAQRSDGVCHVGCCADDLCNVQCNNSQVPPITEASTTAVPQTTIMSTTKQPHQTPPTTTNVPSTTIVSHCRYNSCVHGTCSEHGDTFICSCYTGYYGTNCAHDIRPNSTTTSTSTTKTITTTTPTPRDPCHGYDCQHDSKCVVENHKPKCICSPAYYGNHCENRRHCESTSAYKHTFDWNHRKLHASFVQVSMNHHDALRYCKSHCLGQLIQLTTMDKYNLIHNFLRHNTGYVHVDFWVDGTWSGHHWTTSSGDRLVEQSEAWRRTTSWGVDGHCLQCLVCDDMVDPTDCNIVLTCGDYQECFLESYVNIGGFERYNMGCRDSLQCGQSDPTGKLLVCSHCCQNDLCNSQGCSTQGYPKSRGPLCFNCQSQKYVDDCISITMCGRDEKCEEEQLMLTTAQRSDGVCHVGCCSDDLCNVQCNNSQIPSIGEASTTAVPQTTIMSTTKQAHQTPPTTTNAPSTTIKSHCLPNPCVHGVCHGRRDTFICTCYSGYYGINCEQAAPPTTPMPTTNAPSTTIKSHCLPNPCVHGVCHEHRDTFICTCYSGYYGINCAQATITHSPHQCSPNPCRHGICVVENGRFHCKCYSNYTGTLCEKVITTTTTLTTTLPTHDPCHGYNCQHGGRCIVEHDQPKCICSPAYSGNHCGNPRHCPHTNAYEHTFDWKQNQKLHVALVHHTMSNHDAINYCQSHCLGHLIQLTTMEKFRMIHSFLHNADSHLHTDFWVDGIWNGHHWTTSSGTRLVEQSEAWTRTNTWGTGGHCTRLKKSENYALNDFSCQNHYGLICEYIL